MDLSVARVAETLSHEFADLHCANVISVLTACACEYPQADSYFIEQATRGRLLLLTQPAAADPATGGPDALDVSLHDCDLADEVELLGRLMVAANESDRPMADQDVDRVLGVAGRRAAVRPVVPAQR